MIQIIEKIERLKKTMLSHEDGWIIRFISEIIFYFTVVILPVVGVVLLIMILLK